MAADIIDLVPRVERRAMRRVIPARAPTRGARFSDAGYVACQGQGCILGDQLSNLYEIADSQAGSWLFGHEGLYWFQNEWHPIPQNDLDWWNAHGRGLAGSEEFVMHKIAEAVGVSDEDVGYYVVHCCGWPDTPTDWGAIISGSAQVAGGIATGQPELVVSGSAVLARASRTAKPGDPVAPEGPPPDFFGSVGGGPIEFIGNTAPTPFDMSVGGGPIEFTGPAPVPPARTMMAGLALPAGTSPVAVVAVLAGAALAAFLLLRKR